MEVPEAPQRQSRESEAGAEELTRVKRDGGQFVKEAVKHRRCTTRRDLRVVERDGVGIRGSSSFLIFVHCARTSQPIYFHKYTHESLNHAHTMPRAQYRLVSIRGRNSIDGLMTSSTATVQLPSVAAQ